MKDLRPPLRNFLEALVEESNENVHLRRRDAEQNPTNFRKGDQRMQNTIHELSEFRSIALEIFIPLTVNSVRLEGSIAN
jgi:hypothetical protein